MLNGAAHLMVIDTDRAEVTRAAFASVFTYKCFQALVSLWSESLSESYWKILLIT